MNNFVVYLLLISNKNCSKMAKEDLIKNKDYVTANLDKFLNLYRNKYILVNEQQVVGSFDTYEAAAEEGIVSFGIDSGFLVHYVTESNVVNFVSTALI
jgi:hypothetical protein